MQSIFEYDQKVDIISLWTVGALRKYAGGIFLASSGAVLCQAAHSWKRDKKQHPPIAVSVEKYILLFFISLRTVVHVTAQKDNPVNCF